MMEPQLDDSGSETNPLRPLGRGRDKGLRSGNILPAGAVVLPYPCFIKAKGVKEGDQVEISMQSVGRIIRWMMEGLKEKTESHGPERSGHIDIRQYDLVREPAGATRGTAFLRPAPYQYLKRVGCTRMKTG